MGVIVGIDKFMSECRALTNFTGNAVATLLIGKWTHELDMDKAREVLAGRDPFDEINMDDDDHGTGASGGGADGTSGTSGMDADGAEGSAIPAEGDRIPATV